MKLILLGAPGSGKGTQADIICKENNIVSVSTGVLIRNIIRESGARGSLFRMYTDKGQLIPDELVLPILKARLSEQDCENGYILDGFPRTIPQANMLVEMDIIPDAVISYEISDEIIVNRMTGRRTCLVCGSTYHIEYNKPKNENYCDNCGKELIIRDDDKAEVVIDRLSTYHKQTAPLIKFYEKLGKLVKINAAQDIKAVAKATAKVIGKIR